MGHFLGEIRDCVRPQIYFVRAIDLHARVVDEITVRTHPSYVREIGGRARGQIEHELARNPAAVAQRQRNVVLLEQRQHSFGDPATVPELDCDSQVLGNPPEEIDERRQLTGLKIRAHLNEYGAELVAQLTNTLEEDLRGA